MCNCCTHTESDHTESDHTAATSPVDYINHLVNTLDHDTLQDLAVALAQHTKPSVAVTVLQSLWLLPSQIGVDYNPENTL